MLQSAEKILVGTGTDQRVSGRRAALPVEGRTIGDAYLRRLELNGKDPAYQFKKNGNYEKVTWSEFHASVLGCFRSLREMGIQRGDKVAILSLTRPEWSIADLANLSTGVVTVPIYQSSSVEDIAFILDNSETKLIYVEEASLCRNVQRAFSVMGKSLPVVTFNEVGTIDGLACTPFWQFIAGEKTTELDREFRRSALEIDADSPASIVYTSGTTGKPKGVVLTHRNFTSGISAVASEVNLTVGDTALTFLPFAHILGRVESLSPVFSGVTLGYAENLNTIAQNMGELSPSVMIAVPRIYEKVYAKILGSVESQSNAKKSIFQWAVVIGSEVAGLRSEKKPLPLLLALKYQIADRLVFNKVRNRLGGKLRISASGGAPLAPEICKFFHACGVKVLEGYGLTETLGPITVNHPEDYRFGTVGKPLRGAEIKIAQDGEILMKGPMVFREYYRNPQATQEAFTPDGWFQSGDIGEIDERGFLKITDRKKELIITSGGKNVAPQKLENLLKMNRFISNVMTFGDRQKYIVALIAPNEEEVKNWAATEGIPFSSFESLVENPRFIKLVDTIVSGVNRALASYESIKKFKTVSKDFTVEGGELTPSLKLKRKVIAEKYKRELEELYR